MISKIIAYCFLILLISITSVAKCQYLCDNEYKVINKQKRKIKKSCKKKAQTWLAAKKDSLNLPNGIKLSKLKFRANEKEIDKVERYNKWHEIDSLLCIKTDAEYAKQAIKRLSELKLVVFDIRTEFNFIPTPNEKIPSVLNFEFDINGQLLRAVIRKKKMSPYSEIPLK